MPIDFPAPMDELDFRKLLGGERTAEELARQIHDRTFNMLLDYLRRRSAITLQDLEAAGMPNVTLRLATVQLLFDGVREAIQNFASTLLVALDDKAKLTAVQKLTILSTVIYGDLHGSGVADFASMTNDEASERLAVLKKNLEDPVDKGPYNRALREVGKRIGWSFSTDLIRYARADLNQIPMEYLDLLRYWALFDSATDLAGKIDIEHLDEGSAQARIHVQESFLRRSRQSEPHTHCAFLEGYILGVVDGLMISWYHWLSVTKYRLPSRRLRVSSVKELPGPKCVFEVELVERPDGRVERRLADAVAKVERDDLKGAVMEARSAMEEAVKVAMDLPVSAQLRFANFMDDLAAVDPGVDCVACKIVYARQSEIVHGRSEGNDKNLVRELIAESWLQTRQFTSGLSAERRLALNERRGRWLVRVKSS